MKHQFKFSITAAVKALRIFAGEDSADGMSDDYHDACRPCKGCGLTHNQVWDQMVEERFIDTLDVIAEYARLGAAFSVLSYDDCKLRQRKNRLRAFW